MEGKYIYIFFIRCAFIPAVNFHSYHTYIEKSPPAHKIQ